MLAFPITWNNINLTKNSNIKQPDYTQKSTNFLPCDQRIPRYNTSSKIAPVKTLHWCEYKVPVSVIICVSFSYPLYDENNRQAGFSQYMNRYFLLWIIYWPWPSREGFREWLGESHRWGGWGCSAWMSTHASQSSSSHQPSLPSLPSCCQKFTSSLSSEDWLEYQQQWYK